MRVLFLVDVTGVAMGGDVKEVKNGFARNYLIPQQLAVPATHDALQRIERLKQQAESTRVNALADMSALGKELNGTQINIAMRAGSTGRLYGSVTTALVASELSRVTTHKIDRRIILMPEAIRKVGRYDVRLRLHSDVRSEITLVVYPDGTDPADLVARLDAEESDEVESTVSTEDEADITTVSKKPDIAEKQTNTETEITATSMETEDTSTVTGQTNVVEDNGTSDEANKGE